MKGLKILLIPIIVIILLVVGLLFGLRIYGDHHPNNKSIKSFNMRNPPVSYTHLTLPTNREV